MGQRLSRGEKDSSVTCSSKNDSEIRISYQGFFWSNGHDWRWAVEVNVGEFYCIRPFVVESVVRWTVFHILKGCVRRLRIWTIKAPRAWRQHHPSIATLQEPTSPDPSLFFRNSIDNLKHLLSDPFVAIPVSIFLSVFIPHSLWRGSRSSL